jgi:hypothetical protein
VASLDASVDGLLTPLPRPGTRLLFARTEADGRIVLVRSGPLDWFEELEPVAEANEDDVTLRPATIAPPAEPADIGFGEQAEEVYAPLSSRSSRAPATRSMNEEETAPFSRTRQTPYASMEEMAAVTRRSPSTVRGFPPPPAGSSRSSRRG